MKYLILCCALLSPHHVQADYLTVTHRPFCETLNSIYRLATIWRDHREELRTFFDRYPDDANQIFPTCRIEEIILIKPGTPPSITDSLLQKYGMRIFTATLANNEGEKSGFTVIGMHMRSIAH